MADVTCIEEKISMINFRITDYYLMNVTNLCLNVDIKVNLNYLNWEPLKQAHRFWMIFMGIITFISVITRITGFLCWERDSWNF